MAENEKTEADLIRELESMTEEQLRTVAPLPEKPQRIFFEDKQPGQFAEEIGAGGAPPANPGPATDETLSVLREIRDLLKYLPDEIADRLGVDV
jgi:hypothetical protein